MSTDHSPGGNIPNGGTGGAGGGGGAATFQNKFLQMHLSLDNARLNNVTGLLKPNPYAEVIVDGKPPKKTETCKSSYHPKWQSDFTVVVTPYSKIVFRVYDHSILKKDALLGDCCLDLYSLLKKHCGRCQNTELALDLKSHSLDHKSEKTLYL